MLKCLRMVSRPKHVAYILTKLLQFIVVDGSIYMKIDTIYRNGMGSILKNRTLSSSTRTLICSVS